MITRLFSCIIAVCFNFHHVVYSFDISDIENGIYHKVDIVPTPITINSLFDDEIFKDQEIVQLASVYGQRYSCSYKPPAAVLANQTSEPENPWNHVNITSLMEGYFNGTNDCFKATKGWWTYEVCPWQYVVQYHDDREAKTSSGRSLLGLFAREFNWTTSNETEKEIVKKFHSQHYENGTTCDLTGKPRAVDIQYLCQKNDDKEDGIADIQEPETCRYTIQIHIHALCQSSVFRRSKGGHIAVGIKCQPTLSDERYRNYQERERIFKEKQEREKEELRKQKAEREKEKQLVAILEKQLTEAYDKFSMEEDVSQYLFDSAFESEDERKAFEEELEKVGKIRSSGSAKLRSSLTEQFESILDEAEKELVAAEKNSEVKTPIDREKALKTLELTLEKILNKIESGDPRENADNQPDLPSDIQDILGIPGVSVKIDSDVVGKESLNEAIKKELEKIGIKPGARQLEIRVMSSNPKARSKSEDSSPSDSDFDEEIVADILPKDSGKALGQMIAAVLVTDTTSVRTVFEQQNLENNYALNFDDTMENIDDNGYGEVKLEDEHDTEQD